MPKEIAEITRPQKDGSVKIFYRLTLVGDVSFDRIFHSKDEALEKYHHFFPKNELPEIIKSKEALPDFVKPVNKIKTKNTFEKNKDELSKKMVLPGGITKEKIEKSLKVFNDSESWQDFFNKMGEIYSQENFYKYKLYFEMIGFAVSGKLKGAKLNAQNDEVFVENSIFHRSTVKRKIISQNLIPYECSTKDCGNKGVWLGKSISLHLEHKNGIPSDNRLENLTFLCPNCHSQTETYSGKSKKVKNRIGGKRIKIAQDWAISKGGSCLSEDYESAQKKMKWKCHNPDHPVWETSYSKVINDKSWCPACVRGNNQFTQLLNKN